MKFKKYLSLILSIIACALGGGAMAIDTPEAMTYGSTDDDPNKGTSLEGAVKTNPTDKGGVVQHGQGASGSALQQMNLLNNKMFQKIIEHHALRYPFYSDLFTKATQFAFKGHKEAEYPEVGDIKTEANLKYAAYNSDGSTTSSPTLLHEVALALNAGDATIFRKNYTIIVPSMQGYDEGVSDVTNGEQLMLYVVDNPENNSGKPKVIAINGPWDSDNNQTLVPQIAAGTLLILGAPALAEEEVEVDPLNIMPTTRKAYLQKKGYSVAISDFFDEAVKEVDWEKDRIKRQTLDAYKKIYTTTTLFGAKRKWYKQTRNGFRLCYTQEGTINQLRMMYELRNGAWTKADLIAIAKMLFTAYTDATSIDLYMGSDAIEGLLNIDWGEDVCKVIYMKDENLKINVASFETPYGILRFKHEKALTFHHLEKAAIAIPMEDCLRIYRDNGTTYKVDGKKGETGVVEELTKEFFIQDDCFVCNSMASMLIGPSDLFTSGYGSGIEEVYKSTESLGVASENSGKMVYLVKSWTAPSISAPSGTTAGTTYLPGIYKSNGTTWEAVTRGITA